MGAMAHMTAWPTYEEPTSDCSDCVSQAQYDELASLVSMQADQIAALEASMQNMAGLEATVNDVDSALTDMATCIAGYASGDMDDMDSTMMPTMPITDEPTKVPSMSPTAFWLYMSASEY